MSPSIVRPGTPADLETLRVLNDAEVPRVNVLSAAVFARTASEADLFVVAERGAEVAGFAWVLGPGRQYGSENYAWFAARHDAFWYLDRIVVAAAHRRRGVARALYAAVFAGAEAAGVPRVTCEVNVAPANPASLALHADLGFVEAGERTAHGKTVVMLERATNPGPRTP